MRRTGEQAEGLLGAHELKLWVVAKTWASFLCLWEAVTFGTAPKVYVAESVL